MLRIVNLNKLALVYNVCKRISNTLVTLLATLLEAEFAVWCILQEIIRNLNIYNTY